MMERNNCDAGPPHHRAAQWSFTNVNLGLFAVQAGSLITRLEAVDADNGPNSDLLYDIASGNDDSAFQIDRSTGIITVAAGGALTRRASRLHRVVVVAEDRGTPTQQTVADLTIAVNDSVVVVAPLGGKAQRQGGVVTTTIVLAGGAAVGGALVIGCIVVVAVIVCFLRRRRTKRQRRREELEKRNRSR